MHLRIIKKNYAPDSEIEFSNKPIFSRLNLQVYSESVGAKYDWKAFSAFFSLISLTIPIDEKCVGLLDLSWRQ